LYVNRKVLLKNLLSSTSIKNYFKFKYRGEYYADIKQNVIAYLWDSGWKCEDIVELIFGDRKQSGMVSHYRNKRKLVHGLENWEELIEDGLYPITKSRDTNIGHEGYYELEKR